MAFKLHEKLREDSLILGRFELCLLLRIKDQNYPWYVLVPERPATKELFELSENDRQLYYKESHIVSKALSEFYKADKINVASIGNMVPQLHIHHIARFKDDVAWPHPVWGRHPMKSGELSLLEKDARDFVGCLNGFVKTN
jgi:diadenosine tetraphosphate (Ap4A) HIT family hydrolase